MAQQALTTQIAVQGRFVLGLGPSHKVVIENVLGLSFARPAQHVSEYVQILGELMRTGKSSFRGELYRVNANVSIVGSTPVPILIGALQPRMRRIAGRHCEGTITWMTGPRAIEGQIAPDLCAAAREAGRPAAPRIVVGLPVCVTSDVAAAREAAARGFAGYGNLPSYRAMLDAEGAKTPGDMLIAGDAAEVERGIERLRSAGATDFNASIFGYGEDRGAMTARTWELLSELARRG
jgi:F420-dependent oxidoreductase-like protein